MALAVGGLGIISYIVTTWMKIGNGYPLESSWGKPMLPQKNEEMLERVKLVSQENAQLRAELSSVKDRLANVERIVTDGAHTLSHDIEQLRSIRSN
ncbi:hypothetical protein [Sphingomonas antarctica]|uniref:hypothetical protein n=1 Tax=Sphingomonas antarctica TaxID=2040274 RepID=UPI0039EA7FBD